MQERERTAGDISVQEKVLFLQRVREGLNRQEAAFSLDIKPRLFRSLCSPQSPFYDEEFARDYGEAVGSLEHEQFRLERLRAEGLRRALVDSDRLLEKFLMVYDPDWEKLRTREVNISVDVVIERVFKKLPLDQVQQIRDWLRAEQAAEVVEGEIVELPPGHGILANSDLADEIQGLADDDS